VVGIAAGEYHSLAVRADGTVVAWGDNSEGQSSVPPDLAAVAATAGGGGHTVALAADGSLVAWGADWNGQCDIPPDILPAAGVAAGSYHTVALIESATPPPRLLNPARNGNCFSALLQTLNRKSYALEYKDSLNAASWTALSTNAGNGALITVADPSAAAPRRFYRTRQW
jgi:hypothetical protein